MPIGMSAVLWGWLILIVCVWERRGGGGSVRGCGVVVLAVGGWVLQKWKDAITYGEVTNVEKVAGEGTPNPVWINVEGGWPPFILSVTSSNSTMIDVNMMGVVIGSSPSWLIAIPPSSIIGFARINISITDSYGYIVNDDFIFFSRGTFRLSSHLSPPPPTTIHSSHHLENWCDESYSIEWMAWHLQ